jgi:hypothetical protein
MVMRLNPVLNGGLGKTMDYANLGRDNVIKGEFNRLYGI